MTTDIKIYDSNRNDINSYDGALVTTNYGVQLDAFARFRVSNPYVLFDSKLIKDSASLYWDDKEVSGSGTTSAHQTNKSCQKLSVSDNTAGLRVRQSKIRGNYQPGKSQLIIMTSLAGAGQSGITKRWGYFDNNNGLGFYLKGNEFGVFRRTFTSGSVVTHDIPQASFNGNKLDGTGFGGFNIDLSKSQRFFIDFEWLAVGDVRWGVVIDNLPILAHRLSNTNTLDTAEIVYMTTPNLPLRYEISNDGTGLASDLYAICGTIISEGGQESTAITTYISRNGVPITLANQDLYTPVISIRLKSTANAGTVADVEGVCTRVSIDSLDMLASTNFNYEWRLLINPTLAGVDAVNWVNVPNSSIQYDVSRTNANVVSEGYILSGGYGSSSAQLKLPLGALVDSFLTLGSNIDFTTDEIVLAVANIEANGGTMYGGLSVKEYC